MACAGLALKGDALLADAIGPGEGRPVGSYAAERRDARFEVQPAGGTVGLAGKVDLARQGVKLGGGWRTLARASFALPRQASSASSSVTEMSAPASVSTAPPQSIVALWTGPRSDGRAEAIRTASTRGRRAADAATEIEPLGDRRDLAGKAVVQARPSR